MRLSSKLETDVLLVVDIRAALCHQALDHAQVVVDGGEVQRRVSILPVVGGGLATDRDGWRSGVQ